VGGSINQGAVVYKPPLLIKERRFEIAVLLGRRLKNAAP
jgi:hypothetical protein